MILLDLEACRYGVARTGPGRPPKWWMVCPECLWLTCRYHFSATSCQRPAAEAVVYGGPTTPATCYDLRGRDIWMVVVPEAIADPLSSALMLGGVNAVVQMLPGITPQELGLPSHFEKAEERHAKLGH